MKEKNFENILKKWKENQLERISRVKYPKTDHCFSYEKFTVGDFTEKSRSRE